MTPNWPLRSLTEGTFISIMQYFYPLCTLNMLATGICPIVDVHGVHVCHLFFFQYFFRKYSVYWSTEHHG